ncbi:SDR family oxidoreductase [Sodalis sp. RH22]|uniref:SDR family oxidoreductase n=1 Tax=unclassified Sodalis (in: enterobacteria) TaxID=2636512 RepID=UPI0039B57337
MNGIAPGLIADTRFFCDPLPPERMRSIAEETSLGRAGEPDEIAATVSYLASYEATFITGVTIAVNRGLSPVAQFWGFKSVVLIFQNAGSPHCPHGLD